MHLSNPHVLSAALKNLLEGSHVVVVLDRLARPVDPVGDGDVRGDDGGRSSVLGPRPVEARLRSAHRSPHPSRRRSGRSPGGRPPSRWLPPTSPNEPGTPASRARARESGGRRTVGTGAPPPTTRGRRPRPVPGQHPR
ncbi:hypothetical protein [Ornithinimicrobium kibberense]|uniref:hypothetical protein n=1 Tax=Ornithinimicrobium kibberense TaxID=282060 RepID=UPI003616C093